MDNTKKCALEKGVELVKETHVHEEFRPIPKRIFDDVLDAVGNTPLIRINKLGPKEGIQCELLAKCEFMNMGGSVKDRIGKRMVLDAEKRGLLKKGDRIVEATSGNTGIGLAMACATRGYECIITMPEKMSTEKANVLKGLGATVIRTPTEAGFEAPESHIGVSLQLEKDGAVLLDQYSNPSNPVAHYDQLAEEILYQCEGKVDAIVIGVGTGGTVTGVSMKVKEKSPNTIMVGADPIGSILALPDSLNVDGPPNLVEGIGYDFIPRVCCRESVDHWVKTDDVDSFVCARNLISSEGLLVGGSSGAVMHAAKEFIKAKGWENDKTKRVVCVFQDSIRNYLTKFLSKEWCIEKQIFPYEELKEESNPFNGVKLSTINFPEVQAVEDITVGEARDLFAKGAKIIPIKAGEKIVYGILPNKFLELVILKKLKCSDSVLKTKTKDFVVVPDTLDAGQLSKILERNEAVVIEHRSADNKIEKLWAASSADLFHLMK